MGKESFTFTVGKLDAGMAILIGERAHLIEFPSLLLPPGVTSGSIVNIAVHRNVAEEERQKAEFWALQDDILNIFGKHMPEAPKLEVRNVTQTSVTLEWPPLKLATAKLRSLEIYRNNQRLASIPSPLQNLSTKLSSLELNTEYSFQLVLKTSAGTFPSNVLKVRTHTINDTSGISVCFGNVEDGELLEAAKESLARMRARWSEKIQIDTTHFVCTTPAAVPPPGRPVGYLNNPPGVEYQRALQLSIPVVQPQWVIACDTEKKMVPTASYYLGVTVPRPATSKRTSLAAAPSAPSSPDSPPGHQRGASVPAPEHHPYPSQASRMPGSGSRSPPAPLPEEDEREGEAEPEVTSPRTAGHARVGTMARDFKFPPVSPASPTPPVPPVEMTPSRTHPPRQMSIVAVEVPPPPPVEKERTVAADDGDGDDVGETVEVDLS